MGWRDAIEQGSFRGITFHVDTNEYSSGRRTALHQYPNRDAAYIEDMGREARAIAFDAYIVGDDYLQQKNDLIAALEQAGPGELVHPLYGVRTVQAGAFSVRENQREGRFVRFAMEFTETALPGQPSDAADTQSAVERSADDAAAALGEALTDTLDVTGLPQWAVSKAATVVELAGDVISAAFAPVQLAADEAADLNQQINRLTADAEGLAREPDELLDVMNITFGTVAGTDSDVKTRIKSLLDLYDGYAPAPENTDTSTREAAERNRAAVEAYVRSRAVIEAARIAPEQDYDSLQAARATRDAIAERMDEQADTADDGVYIALRDLRARLVLAVPGEGESLPRLATITLQQSEPALLTAYRLYEDAGRGDRVAARNNIRHPGFMPGGVPLEVLTSD